MAFPTLLSYSIHRIGENVFSCSLYDGTDYVFVIYILFSGPRGSGTTPSGKLVCANCGYSHWQIHTLNSGMGAKLSKCIHDGPNRRTHARTRARTTIRT